MRHSLGLFLLFTPSLVADETEPVTIYRDSFGIPHIYAKTEEGAVYGMGYAQAEDRLEELLKQYRRATGTMSEAFGPAHLEADYRQRLWKHAEIAEKNYPKLDPKIRSIVEAYQDGIRAYMREHPERVPEWAPDLKPWQVVALARYIIWGWPEHDANRDLENGRIPITPVAPRGSNQWAVRAERTADGHPIALIDPHLSWYGQFRFYEARLYGGELALSGMSIPGLPFSSLGHNRYCSVAMTTGGPDCADVYEEEIDPENPRRFKYDGAWRDMTVSKETIRVRLDNKVVERVMEIEHTHHGPIVARKDGKAYAVKLAYFPEFRLLEQAYKMALAKNLKEMKEALSMFQLMEQNIMIATVDGDIFYVRNGRVPIRPKGFDWTRPVPGSTSKSEWRGFHKLEDLVRSENPWQGYLQNCNNSPAHMNMHCAMTPQRYAEHGYLYNEDFPLHQRAAMTLKLLDQTTKMTLDDAFRIAMSTEVYNADLWQLRLAEAWKRKPGQGKLAKLYEMIVRWNRHADADSTGAVAYHFWKSELGIEVLRSDRAGLPPPELSDEVLLRALEKAVGRLEKEWGRSEVRWGEIHRVGRRGGEETWPVGGGSVMGMATPRAIGFRRMEGGNRWLGVSGQTSTQVVQLTKPPRSWTLLPLGQSDDPKSHHFDDQAEKLFSPAKLKPTFFDDKEGLLKQKPAKTLLHRKIPSR